MNGLITSSFPIKEETMLNSSFIDMFGHIVSNITKDEDVHELFEAAMLNESEVVEDISGFSQNKEKSGSNVLAPVMPLDTYGECVTFGLEKSAHQLATIKYTQRRNILSIEIATFSG